MSKFHFRLATLMKVREATRDQCRMTLAESQRADEELMQRIARLQGKQQRLRTECREAAGPGEIDVRRLVEANCYAEALQRDEDELHRQRALLAVEIERQREAVVAADREVQVLEKLREHRQREYRREEERQDGKRLDEAAIQAVGR